MLHHARPIAISLKPHYSRCLPQRSPQRLSRPSSFIGWRSQVLCHFSWWLHWWIGRIFLKSKDKTFPAFKSFKIQSERGTYIIQRLRTDYGGEYEDYDFRDFRFDHSIQWEPAVPLNKTTSQNDWVKLLCVKLAPCFEAPAWATDTGTKWSARLIISKIDHPLPWYLLPHTKHE